MRAAGSLISVLLWCTVCGSNLFADDLANHLANHWIQRMNSAVSELDYDGQFVYLRGDMLDAMKIRHRVDGRNTREHLISLTGTAREVIRDNNSITIIQSLNGKTHISQHRTTVKLSPLPLLKPEELKRNYRLLMGEDMRMAGRMAKVILLQPKDNLRYACRLVLDQSNALPLGVTLFDKEGKQVSRIMFTDLQVVYSAEEVSIADGQDAVESLESLSPTNKSTSVRVQEANKQVDLLSVTHWRFDTLPAGYRLKNYHFRNKTEAIEWMEHFVFSDGLATISVYVEPLAETGLRGETNLGAINALGAQVVDHQLTIVGEVPLTTLKLLLSGARLKAG